MPADTRRVYDLSRDGVLRSIEDSLERLGVDRIDIVYMHDPDDHWEAASTTGAQALSELRDEGVIRGLRRRDEPGRDARRPHRADGRRHRHVRGPLDAARAGSCRADAAPRRRAGCRGRRGRRLQLGAAEPRARAGRRPLQLRPGSRRTSSRGHATSSGSAASTAPRCPPPRCSSRCGTRRSCRWSPACAAPSQARETVERLTAPLPDELWRALGDAGHIRIAEAS